MGNGTLITPTIVVYARGKYPQHSRGDGALRELRHRRRWNQIPQSLGAPWTGAPSILASDVGVRVFSDDVHMLTAVWERRADRMGLWCQHPQSFTPLRTTYVAPPEAEWGVPLDDLYVSPRPDYIRDRTYELYRQRCADPLDVAQAPTSNLLFLVLRERVADVVPARPVFFNPGIDPITDRAAAIDPAFWRGRSATLFDFGFNDFADPNLGFRTSRDVVLDGVRPAGQRTCDGFGGIEDVIGSTDTGTCSGSAGAPYIVDIDGSPRLLQTTSALFLGDDVVRQWLDQDGDGFMRGDFDACDGPCNDPIAPTNCTDADHDCFGNNDNCDLVSNPSQRDTDGDGLGDECDLCPIVWDTLASPPANGVVHEPRLPLLSSTAASYPAATCAAVRTQIADDWHPAVAIGSIIGAACSDFGAAGGGGTGGPLGFTRMPTPFIATDNPRTTTDEAVTGIYGIWEDSHTTGVDVMFDDAVGIGATDFDDDGIPFLCDNCPDTFNPGQEDCDGRSEPDTRPGRHPGAMQLVGDACSPDDDHDGVPNNCDVCPQTADTLLSCNRDAEDVRRATVYPDSCDPVPCADVNPTTLRGTPIGGLLSLVTTNARLAGPAMVGSPNPALVQNTAFTGTGNVGFRFCPCDTRANDELSRTDCARDSGCALSRTSDPLGGGPEDDLYATATLSTAWRPMTVTSPAGLAPNAGGEFATTFRSTLAPRAPDRVEVDWPFESDPAAASSLVIEGDGPGGSGLARTRGVIWTQVRASSPCATSASPTRCQFLAAHYWSGQIQRAAIRGPDPHTVTGTGLVPWPAPEDLCPFCASSFPGAFLGTTCLDLGTCGFDRWVLRTDAIELLVGSQMSGGLGKALLSPLVSWNLAAEPIDVLTRDATRMVGTTFGAVVARVRLVGSALATTQESGQPFFKQSPERLAAAAALFDATGETNPNGRAMMLFGNQHRLVALGGDVIEQQSLRFTDLENGEETSTHLIGPRPAVVLAAAPILTAHSALVLDRGELDERAHCGRDDDREDDRRHGHERHRPSHARLLLVDLTLGTSRVLATIPWLERYDHWALVSLDGGDVVLVASSAQSSRHRVLRLRVRGATMTVVASAQGSGALVAAPSASRRGVSLAVARRRQAWTVVGYPLEPSARRRDRRAEDELDEMF